MSTPQQVANSFVVDFFERLAKNPADLAELYGHNAVLTINDFEMGTTEAHDAEVAPMMEKWAMIVQGSQLRVESVNAAALYSGVNVFVTLTAVGELQQYFQITTTLESWASGFAAEGYYIRHQVISRIGALPSEPTPAEPAATTPAAAAVESPAPEPVTTARTPTPTPSTPREDAAEDTCDEPPAPPVAPSAAPHAPVAKPVKTWAKLASSAPTKSAEAPRVVRVVAASGKKEEKTEEETAGNGAAANHAAPREHARRERKPLEPLGDRLMFPTEVSVTDEEVRAALGPMAASLVSLRNNSEKGHVFMDFAANVKAYETLRKTAPTLGANKGKINIFRQRNREEK